MNDDISDVKYLRYRLASALERARALPEDVWELDGLQLAGMVMRLDELRAVMEDGWSTLHAVYDDALDRDRALSENRTVGGSPDGRSGVVADIFGAVAAGVRPDGSVVDYVGGGAEDVARV